MKKVRLILTLTFLFAGLAAVPAAAGMPEELPDRIRRAKNPVPNSYLVTLKADERQVPEAAADLARDFGGTLSHVYTHALKGFAIRLPEEAALRMALNPRVVLVEEDAVATIIATQSNPPWGLDRIDQRDLPLTESYTYDSVASEVSAYIIDTGILPSHQDFGGRASVGFDAFNDGQNGIDCHGHGTHVTGTVGGSTYGVAKSASLVGVRVLDCSGNGAYSGVIAGVDWVTGNGVVPAVANMSLGGGPSTTLDTAIRNSISAGTTYVVAAGNDNANACDYSPARTLEAITVGASTTTDSRASFSNYGSCLDIFAPGVGTVSTYHTSDSATANLSGTSMATPHVAGAAALYLSENPSATPAAVASALNGNSTTNKISSAGSGSPNRLLFSGPVGDLPANLPPVANFTTSCTNLTCTFTDSSTDADGTISSRAWAFGDGSTSTATNPKKTYSAVGTYTVKLTVTDNQGATGTKEQQLSVPTDPDSSVPNLQTGVGLNDLSGASGSMKYYKIFIPSGRSKVTFALTASPSCSKNCNPNLDLYARVNTKPTTSSYTCRSATSKTNETCSRSRPASGWWYVGVRVASGTNTLNYTIKATY